MARAADRSQDPRCKKAIARSRRCRVSATMGRPRSTHSPASRSVKPSAGFQPTRTHSSAFPWSFYSRWRFDDPRKVGLALFQESRERLFCVVGADLRTELFILGLYRGL